MQRFPLLVALVAILGSCGYTADTYFVGSLHETKTCTDTSRNSSGLFKRMLLVGSERDYFNLYDSTTALKGPRLAGGTLKPDDDEATITGGSGLQTGSEVPYAVREGTFRFDGDEVTVRIVFETNPNLADACTTVSEGTLIVDSFQD